MPNTKDTATRRRCANSKDRAVKNLNDKSWKFDGLWWISPYTGTRYSQKDAVAVEELRKWGDSDSAFLNDMGHSMWTIQERRDNELVSMDDLSKISHDRKLLRDSATRSNIKGKGSS